MLKLTIHDREHDRDIVRFGTDHELVEYLHAHFPDTKGWRTPASACQALTAGDRYVAQVEPYHESPAGNLLPENYLEQSSSEDPWPREADEEK